MSRQEKPPGWPEGRREGHCWPKDPIYHQCQAKMAVRLQRAFRPHILSPLGLKLWVIATWWKRVLEVLKVELVMVWITMPFLQPSIRGIDVNVCMQIHFRAYLALAPRTSIWSGPVLLEGKRATGANVCKFYSIDRVSLFNTCQCAAAMSMTCPISR